MYKVMLVDDERMILDGISQVVDWRSSGTELIATARNGIEAYEKIISNKPDIVISDICMPGLDGLGLVEKTWLSYPSVKFIMLSGHKDFDYARRAMQYGVKHYLLKPCNESQILKAIQELLKEREEQQERDKFMDRIKHGLQKVLPHVKEQFLKEFITNKTYGTTDVEYYEDLFELSLISQSVRMVLIQLDEIREYEYLFALKNIAEDILPSVLLSTTIEGRLLILLPESDHVETLIQDIEMVRSTFYKFYKLDITIALSEADRMVNARKLYREMLQCMNHRFYIGEGSLIMMHDLALHERDGALDLNYILDEEKFCLLIKSGNIDEVGQDIERLFTHLDEMRLEIAMTRSYVLQLYAAMIRICPSGEINSFTKGMTMLAEMETLAGLKIFVIEAANQLTKGYYKNNIHRQSSTVDKMISIIVNNYKNDQLSLNGVANQILYMNPDYLGKIFKKVTGNSFSNYVNQYRIQRACEYIRSGDNVRVFELADQFGFSGNSQYFSQVFKKYIGMTPTEFIKS
ncbi:response regulator transcription factor [Paenibacillus crassostreae]|uniref:AraC family transcriptional regulator n=1 Tax=Paenibacillus crassostreae TaxID=1763538 RepID=A0A167CTM0_9BACL|nr:response regulator [Paenibacillus crassostreae]AOZ93544.1 DNA-binding response regulator [Paenibacillus crassostreae]OAB73564.1 AraC family transcriptional regulator [Paenibacillus crassostreae]